ncbi:MAG: tRNA (guanosine(37)-N1)-methyltransferase TrmD [Candidatus Paceibacterota bacterium]|jgi:tRNA (guanine37-N1)-methyltransferase
MLSFDIITIFPEIFDSYFKESLIKRALEKKLLKVKVHNLRKWASDKHKTVDDRPFGGGIGMVMKVEPIYKAVTALKGGGKDRSSKKTKVILFTPRGKKFNQAMATRLSKMEHLILICGRYEGVDERVAKHIADEEISIGDYVLMGGELPAMVLLETTARLVPGVLGKPQLLKERITKEKGFIEYPQYSRPEVFSPRRGVKWKVPEVLMSGDHKKIGEWKKQNGKVIEK